MFVMNSITKIKNLIDRIENLNLTKQQVAELSDLHPVTIQRLYSGGFLKARTSNIEKLDRAILGRELRVYEFLKKRFQSAANKEG